LLLLFANPVDTSEGDWVIGILNCSPSTSNGVVVVPFFSLNKANVAVYTYKKINDYITFIFDFLPPTEKYGGESDYGSFQQFLASQLIKFKLSIGQIWRCITL